jgi:D-amino-acid dehydrogenase
VKQSSSPHVGVIGAGITGVTTAYALLRRGFGVTLFERHAYPAMETSYANGGQLSASHAESWNHWSTVVKGLKWMTRRDAPLLVNPAPSWHKLSWFAEFLAAMPRYGLTTVDSARLAIAARQHLFGWAEEEGIEFDLERRGILHLCRDRDGFEAALRVNALLAQGGLQRRAVTPAEMRALEPALVGEYHGGFYTDSDASGDIHKFTTGLAQAAERRGARCLYGVEVNGLRPGDGGVEVDYRAGPERGPDEMRRARFDAIVICGGTGSRKLAATLGERVNVYPVKGYSITVMLDDGASRAAAPQVSLVDDAAKLVASRLGDKRLRVAGTAEFNGMNYDIRADRIRPLVEWVKHCFPAVDTRSVIPWAGLRPTMPDMYPAVRPARAPGVFYNTGHGHLGWTLAAATAEMTGGLVASSLLR